MATEEHKLPVAVNVSVDGAQEMAGFEVSINGRFWVFTEGFAFVPLAGDLATLACKLDILFLRREHPGNLIRQRGRHR